MAAPPRRRRSFPFFSVALGAILGAGVLMATVFRGDPAGDLLHLLTWMQRLDITSTAAQPPAGRRAVEVAEPAEAQRPIEPDGSLRAAMEKSAAERRANLRTPDDKPDQSAVQEAARLNQALEREREAAQALAREAAQAPARQAAQAGGRDTVTATNTVPSQNRNGAGEASETKLARAIDAPSAQSERLAPRVPENTALTSKLIERASGLLRLGDVGGARLVLSVATENGSARAAFMLAETYDPNVLATWNTMGTGADPVKARELYAKAYAGGIAEARARSEALAK